MKKTLSQPRSRTRKRILWIIGILLLAGVVLAILEKTHVTDFIKFSQAPAKSDKTTSTAPTAQEDFSGGTERNTTVTDKTEGNATDTNGTISSVPAESQWSRSNGDAIIVYSPAKDSVIVNGQSFSGTSTQPRVSFRLIDDVSGVILQGDVGVIDGKFSGQLSFSTTAKQGRLDFYTAKADGSEINNVNVPIRFE